MLPYSLDLRERVVAAYQQGTATITEIAKRFCVGQTFIKKMLRQNRQTGSLEIKARKPGPKKLLSEKDSNWLRRQIKQTPDLTIDQLHERLRAERKVQVSRATVGRAVQSLDLPLKKESGGAGKKPSQACPLLAAHRAVARRQAEVFR